jgi:hypothetical protein
MRLRCVQYMVSSRTYQLTAGPETGLRWAQDSPPPAAALTSLTPWHRDA